MVVGPQQHWLHLNQGTFREWWFEDSFKAKFAVISTPPRTSSKQRGLSSTQAYTPPNGQKRRALGELDYNEKGVQDENLPAPTPGQPRKTSKKYGDRHNPYTDNENDLPIQPDTEIVSLERHTQGDVVTEEEIQLRMTAKKTSRTPASSGQKRAVSCTTTTTTTTEWTIPEEERALAAKTPSTSRSGSGAGSINLGKRASPLRKVTGPIDARSGIRKTSGRIGSVGTIAHVTKVKQ